MTIALVTSFTFEVSEGPFARWNFGEMDLRFSLLVLTVWQEAGLAERALISLSSRFRVGHEVQKPCSRFRSIALGLKKDARR
jgi:hypothetical protein